jgi:hypothetical protein
METREKTPFMTEQGLCVVTGVFNSDYKLVEILLTITNNTDSWSVNIIDKEENESQLIKDYMGIKNSLQQLDGYTYNMFIDSDNNIRMNVRHQEKYVDFNHDYTMKQIIL